MKGIVLAIMTLISTTMYSDELKGKVIDINSNEPVFAAEVKIVFTDNSIIISKTNFEGLFEYNTPKKCSYIITNLKGYLPDTVNFKKLKKNNNIILLESNSVFICTTGEIKYIDEEYNLKYDFKINNESTKNYTDSLNKRQGRWVFTQNDKYDSESKFSYRQIMCIGYYKDNKKVGKWLFIDPTGKIKKTHIYKD